jgi:hypothetical protein
MLIVPFLPPADDVKGLPLTTGIGDVLGLPLTTGIEDVLGLPLTDDAGVTLGALLDETTPAEDLDVSGTGLLVNVMIFVSVILAVVVIVVSLQLEPGHVGFPGTLGVDDVFGFPGTLGVDDVFGFPGVGVAFVKSHLLHGTVTVTVVGPLPQPDWHTLVVTSQP